MLEERLDCHLSQLSSVPISIFTFPSIIKPPTFYAKTNKISSHRILEPISKKIFYKS